MVMPYGWKGNRRSDVAKAMRHRQTPVVWVQWPTGNGDKHPADAPQVAWSSLPFYPLQVRIQVRRFQLQVQLKVKVYKLQWSY